MVFIKQCPLSVIPLPVQHWTDNRFLLSNHVTKKWFNLKGNKWKFYPLNVRKHKWTLKCNSVKKKKKNVTVFLFKTKTKPTGQKNQNLKGNQKSWTSIVFSAFIRLFYVLRSLKIKNFLRVQILFIFSLC